MPPNQTAAASMWMMSLSWCTVPIQPSVAPAWPVQTSVAIASAVDASRTRRAAEGRRSSALAASTAMTIATMRTIQAVPIALSPMISRRISPSTAQTLEPAIAAASASMPKPDSKSPINDSPTAVFLRDRMPEVRSSLDSA